MDVYTTDAEIEARHYCNRTAFACNVTTTRMGHESRHSSMESPNDGREKRAQTRQIRNIYREQYMEPPRNATKEINELESSTRNDNCLRGNVDADHIGPRYLKPATLQYEGMAVLLYDYILYRTHGRLEQGGVCGIDAMDVDLAIWNFFDATEPVREVPYASVKVGIRIYTIQNVFRNGGYS